MRSILKSPKASNRPPFEFILDALEGLDLHTRRMFGCTAIYVGEKIMFVMYKPDRISNEQNPDVGIWLCIPNEYTLSMKSEFPQLRGVSFFQDENSAWQCLPESEPEFEELALKFCKMIKRGDLRIGRIPKPKKKSKKKTKKPVKKKP
jgi:hypothetical protein